MNRLASRFRAQPLVLFSVSLVLAFFACRAALRAQDLDAVSFGGTVSDQNGTVVPAASVTAALLETKSVRAVLTDLVYPVAGTMLIPVSTSVVPQSAERSS